MRYLVAVDDFFPDRPGGMGRVAWDIAQLMRDRGHQVSMVVSRAERRREPPQLSLHSGIRVLHYSRPALPPWHPLRAHRTVQAAGNATAQHFGREPWDVVHMHSPLTGAGVLDALRGHPRYVYTVHSPAVLEQRINWATQGFFGHLKLLFGLGALQGLERRVLRPCADIHTLSEYTRAKVEHFHRLGHRVSVVPYWRRSELQRRYTKREARQRLGWPVDGRLLFTVRKLGPRYGLDMAIRAIAPLARAGRCTFMIAGDGPLRPHLAALVQQLGAADGIRFSGALDEDQLSLAYQAADLFLLPTSALECFGLVVLEALAFGCPVLSTDAGAIPELMRSILPDFVVPVGDSATLRVKTEAFLDGTLRAPSPDALVAHVDRCFGRDMITARIASLLEGGDSMQERATEYTAPAVA